MDAWNELLRSIVLSLCFVLPGGFLCLFTMRERLRYPWPVLILQILAEGVLYYFLRRLSWLGVLPFLGVVFVNYLHVVKAQPNKILFIMMVVVTYLLFMNSLFFVFEGSAYTWDWSDLRLLLAGFAVSLPPMAWMLRRKLWPAICDLDTSGIRWLWTIPALFMALNVIVNSSHIQSLLDFQASWVYTVLTTLFALASTVVSLLVLDMLKKTQDLSSTRENLRMIDAQMALQAKRFEEFQAYIEQIRVLRHDMRHHLRILSGMLAEGATDSAAQYLREYQLTIEEPEGEPICANHVADLVLRRYQSLCRAQGIALEAKVAIPAQFWVSDIELCILLGNALENALNACGQQQEAGRYIRLHVRATDAELGIAMENNCALQGRPGQEMMSTADLPTERAGWGVSSITTVAKKYGGMASFRRAGDIFHMTVLMYPPRAAQPPGS